MRIIDVHCHVGTQAMVVPSGRRSGAESSLQAIIDADYPRRKAALDRFAVDAVVGPTYGYPQPSGPADTRQLNDLLAAYRQREPARFPWVVAAVQPVQGATAADELQRCLRDLGMRGMMVHARLQGIYTDSPSVDPLMEILDAARLPALIHAHSWSKLEAAWRLERLAIRFPRVPIIALDPFSDYENAEEFFEIARRTANITFDTGLIQGGSATIERFVRAFGPERIVLGNALSAHATGYRRSGILLELLESDLTDAEKEAVFSGNAVRLFEGS